MEEASLSDEERRELLKKFQERWPLDTVEKMTIDKIFIKKLGSNIINFIE